MTDFTDLLDRFKQRRCAAVKQLAFDDDFKTTAHLADIQMSIAAIEAVMAEATPTTSPWDDPAFSLAR